MKTGRMVKELIDLFDYKKPVINVVKVEEGELTPAAAILDLLFFSGPKSQRTVVAKFFISDQGTVATVHPSRSEEHEVYSGASKPKEAALAVINWMNGHPSPSSHNTRRI